MTNSCQIKYMQLVGLASIGLLFFVWPIPHTITLRGLLTFFSLFLVFAIAIKRGDTAGLLRDTGRPAKIYAVLSCWLLFQALFISPFGSWATGEVAGQWGTGLAALSIGVFVGLSAENGGVISPRNVLVMLILVLAIHIVYVDAGPIETIIRSGRPPLRGVAKGLTEGIDKSSYLSNYLLAFLGAEIYFRIVHKKRSIPASNIVLSLLMLATLCSIYLESVRNGDIVAGATLFVLTWLFFTESGSSKMKPLLIFLVIISISCFLYAGYRADARWKTFSETVPLALDTEHNKAWLDSDKYPRPKLSDGRPVEESAYLRIAWLKEGSRILAENPLGVGYGRSAFGHGIRRKFGEGNEGAHSHSGLMDMAVGAGIPGLLLLVALLFSLIFEALRVYKRSSGYFGLVLFLILVNFGMRMTVDSIIRDHMLQQIAFLIGILYILMKKEQPEIRTTGKAV